MLLNQVPYLGRKVRGAVGMSAGAAAGVVIPTLRHGETPVTVGAVMGAALVFAISVGGTYWWQRRKARRLFDSSGGRLCTRCAYRLAGLEREGACPECGTPYLISNNIRAWAECAGYR